LEELVVTSGLKNYSAGYHFKVPLNFNLKEINMAKTYRQIIEELDDIILDENKSEEERDNARKERNDIVMELTMRAYG
jgi:hypothetical protein